MNADIVIVGAGIAGLRCGIEILRKRPTASIIILEKYSYKGGRVVSFSKTLEDVEGKCSTVSWENGAGRIFSKHKKLLDLIQHYGLTTIPLSPEQSYIEEGKLEDNGFEEAMQLVLPQLSKLDAKLLAMHTLRELLTKILDKKTTEDMLLMFPYRAEVDTLRADVAIQTFQEEMGTYDGYFVVKEGLSSMIKGMVQDFQKLGGHIFTGHEVQQIIQEGTSVLLQCKTASGEVLFRSPKVICALHADAMKHIPAFSRSPILRHLLMKPLLRIYAVFPTEKGKSWFQGIPRVVSPGPIRYFLPMNPACGTCMLSYTESQDAEKLIRILNVKGEDALWEYLLKEIRKMFPDLEIPEPLFWKAHPWTSGCTYWLPGNYDPYEMSQEALHPYPDTMPGVYWCGESFSLRQAWMEGALEHADLLLEKYFQSM
jgi:hypothetical protein